MAFAAHMAASAIRSRRPALPAYLGVSGPVFRTTRFHHIITPVTNMNAGASPKTAQVNFVIWSQSPGPRHGIPMPLMRPKCK